MNNLTLAQQKQLLEPLDNLASQKEKELADAKERLTEQNKAAAREMLLAISLSISRKPR